MYTYDSPKVITSFINSPIAMSQYGFGQTPNCDGNNCSTNLGVEDCDSTDISVRDIASIVFFLPGSDINHEPSFCNIKGVADFADAPAEVSGSNCSFTPLENCSNGAIWKITCDMPDNFCDPDEIQVDCEGTPGNCEFIE